MCDINYIKTCKTENTKAIIHISRSKYITVTIQFYFRYQFFLKFKYYNLNQFKS